MKFRTKQKHMIDFIFPISLFFMFALCALTVLLFAARIYRSTTENSSLNYSARSGLSYISEKIHQNDADGNIRVGELCGETAPIMEQTYKDSVYYTYIYSYEGALRELYIKADGSADLSAGTRILDVEDFSIEQIDDHLFKFSCTTEGGQTDSILVATKSS